MYHNYSKPCRGKALAALGIAIACVATASADPIETSTSLSFETRNQNLFADGSATTKTESLRFAVLDERDTLLEKGKIQNSQVPLSLATLQVIWNRALATCRAQGYTVPVIGTRISPNQTECINGEINRPYCIAPPMMTHSNCPNIGDNRRRFVRDIGGGIGPRPTQPAKRPYDFGSVVRLTSDLQIGFEGFYTYDLGSVDIDYSADANIRFDKDEAEAGDIVTVTTSVAERDPYIMNSRYPFFEMGLDMWAYAVMEAVAEYAGVDEKTGDQVRATRSLHKIDSRENPDAIDGYMPFTDGDERLLGLRLDTTGYTATILGNEEKVEARYEYNLTWPLSTPDTPENKPGKKPPKYSSPVSFSLVEFAITGPKLDTPAEFGFRCGDCVPARNEILDGKLTNTTPVGNRTLIGGITDGNGIVLPFVDEGEQDVDLARIDVDLDAPTLAAGVPLGVIVQDPVGVFGVELNLLDIDLATFLSVDQSLEFRPNTEVVLTFSVPTEVKGPEDADFASVSQYSLTLGDSLEFRQPENGVTVVPTFTVRNNEFANITQLKISNAIQETIGQIKVTGYVGDNMEEVFGESPNFAMLQITPTLYDPAPIWSTDTAPWSLDGFADLPGQPLSVSLPPPSGGGGSGGGGSGSGGSGSGGSGSGSDSSGGGGGGGATGALFIALLGLAASLRRRARRKPRI